MVLAALLRGAFREFRVLFVYVFILFGTTLADIGAFYTINRMNPFYPVYYWSAELLRQTALFALVSRLGVGTSLVNVYVAMVPLATGMAITMTPLTTLIMSSVPLSRAGVGSAMNDTTRELGGALGVAVLGSVVTSQYATGISGSVAGLPAQARAVADSGLSGALQVGAQVGGEQGAALVDAAKQAFVDGLGWAALVGSATVFSAAIATRFLLPRPAAPVGGIDRTGGDTVGTPASAAPLPPVVSES
jgi:hypothetical protein